MSTLAGQGRRPFRTPAYQYLREADRLPTIDEVADKPLADIVARVKLFDPTGAATWYIAAYDPDTRIAWGIGHIFETEVGSIPMDEIVAVRGAFGLPIERDLYWEPRTLADLLGVA